MGDECKNILVIRYAVSFMCTPPLILQVSSPDKGELHTNSLWIRHGFV